MGKMGLCRGVLVAIAILCTTVLGHALDSQQISDLKQAARQGDTRAMRELAMVYYEGDGVLKDPVMAKCWIRQAYDLGDKQAKRLWNDLALWEYAGDCTDLPSFRQDMVTNRMGDRWQEPVTGMVFIWIPGGCFHMGCHKNAGKCRNDELPAHRSPVGICLPEQGPQDALCLGKRGFHAQGQLRQRHFSGVHRTGGQFLCQRPGAVPHGRQCRRMVQGCL